jgi:hypothetical protein
MEVNSQLHAPAVLSLGYSPRYAFYRRLGRPQSWAGRYGEGKNLLPLPGIKPRLLGRPARSLVAIPTELSRFEEREPSLS